MRRATVLLPIAIVATAIVVNVIVLAVTFVPFLVTYADIPPRDISCSVCGTPEVSAALARAAAEGRGQILEQVHRIWLWWLIPAAVNVVAMCWIWWLSREKPAA
jgi:hypothetical protein